MVDRSRKWELPDEDDLTPDQVSARDLPLEGQHLVVGGPGTGKSVVAVMRARKLAVAKKEYVFLCYNKMLNMSCGQVAGFRMNIQTVHTWFPKAYRQCMGHDCLRPPSKPFDIDWKSVASRVAGLSMPAKDTYIILDEGQDMPPAFYEALVQWGYRNLFVVADQNQRITESNSSVSQLCETLALGEMDIVDLIQNFRNSHPIASLSHRFYTGDPATKSVKLPKESAFDSEPELIEYTSSSWNTVLREILLAADNNPKHLVGVIAANHKVRQRYLDGLKQAPVSGLDHARPPIQTYDSSNRNQESLVFNQGGIMVINQQSCKGLEFDQVFLGDIHDFKVHGGKDELKRKFYVMVSRARSHVALLRKQGESSAVDEWLTDLQPRSPA